MARCAFCGITTKVFPKKFIIAAEDIPACDDCYMLHEHDDELDIATMVLEAGFLKNSYAISEWAEEEAAKRAERAEKEEQYRREHYAGACPKCGGDMLERGVERFLADRSVLPLANLSKWNTDARDYMVVSCDGCGYTEFYDSARYKKPKTV